MQGEALLSMSPASLRSAVGQLAQNPNRTQIVRNFVAALNSQRGQSDGDSGERRDRAARRRHRRADRRPTLTALTMSDMVSLSQCVYLFSANSRKKVKT